MSDVDFVVMVDEQHLGRMEEVERSLEAKGFQVRASVPRAKSIMGRGDESLVQAFQDVPGVRSIRPERGFQLPPMSEDVPQ